VRVFHVCGLCAGVPRVWSVCSCSTCVVCVQVFQVCGLCAGVPRVWSVCSCSTCVVCVQVFQLCGQPSLGMRSRRSARRRNRGQGRRRGQGEGRRRRRRRTTPSSMDHNDANDDDDDDDDEVVAEGYDRRTLVPQTTTTMSLSSTSLPSVSDAVAGSSWMNVTTYGSGRTAAEDRLSTTSTTVVPTSVTSLPSTTDSRPRRTRRPRRNRNRGSRRRKNRQRTWTTPVMTTTVPPFYVDGDEPGLWGMDHQQPQHRESASTSRLVRLIADVRRKLTMNRELVTQMPRSLCSTMTSGAVNERRCWNGTSYTRCMLLSFNVVHRVESSRNVISVVGQHSVLCEVVVKTTTTTPRVRWHQKRTSGLDGARED